MSEDILVTRFREYIRINTMQPTPDYVGADQFIKKYGDELGLKKGSLIRKTHRKLSLTRRFQTFSYASVPACAKLVHFRPFEEIARDWEMVEYRG